jgi:type VI secretion system protein ImpL
MIAATIVTLVAVVSWGAVLLLKPPLWWAAAAVSVLAALVWAWVLWRRYRGRANSGKIEEGIKTQGAAQAEAGPEQRVELDAMEQEFARAVQALKTSKLGQGGADALAVLPWYMIIGPPGTGKSTALRASGLRFPYLSKRGGVQGTGGTRNCEWWLTNDAVLIDTAGRYATEEDNRDEWLGFLDLLARTRPKKPVNGVLVAVSVSDLLGEGGDEGAAELGRRMRERVDEVMARLQLVLPVYVLVTKCDMLPGFVETFADLRKAERGQIWGFTLPLKTEVERGEVFLESFDELLESLRERALRRLGEERQIPARERIHELPQQLLALRPALSAFVDTLVSESVYQDTPILRGAYFTAGMQGSSTVDRVMSAMAEAFGIRAAAATGTAAGEREPEAKSYFLGDVFAKVIFPDQGIAFRNAKAVRRGAIRRWALAGAAMALAILFVAFPVRSYLANRDLLVRAGQAADAVVARLGNAGDGPPPLQALEPLRGVIEQLLDHAEHGRPFTLGFGMYRGDEVLPALERLYGMAVRRSLVDPVAQQDLAAMAAIVSKLEGMDVAPMGAGYARLYELLKLHLLLAPMPDEARLDGERQRLLAEAIAERWGERTPGEPVRRNAELYARLLAQDERLGVARNQALVTRSRRVLARAPFAELALDRLVSIPELKERELTLQGMLGGSVSVLSARARVGGAFTRSGYEEVMKARLEDGGEILEPWVLSGDAGEGEARLKGEVEDLRSLYFERYIREWRRFLDSVSLQVPGGLLPALEELTRAPRTPLSQLFQALAHNTQLGGGGEEARKAAEGLGARVLGAVGLSGKENTARVVLASMGGGRERRIGASEVEQAFAILVEFGYAPRAGAGQRTPLDVYEEQLGFMREAMQRAAEGGDPAALSAKAMEASTKIQPLIDAREGWRPFLTALLMSPVSLGRARGEADKLGPVAQGWCGSVAPAFQKTIADRYPFARTGEDASIADVTEFFRGGGILWGFYESSLRPMVERSATGFTFVKTGGRPPLRESLLMFLKRAQDVTGALFPGQGSSPSVAVSVRIRPTPNVAAVLLEVDGQRVDYRNGPEEWRPLTWPGASPGATLRVRTADGREETLHRDGEWGLFRLLEAGTLRGEPGSREFSVGFNLPGLGLVVTADFRAARAETPFFAVRRSGSARLFEPLRAGLAPPSDIRLGSGGCR